MKCPTCESHATHFAGRYTNTSWHSFWCSACGTLFIDGGRSKPKVPEIKQRDMDIKKVWETYKWREDADR